MKYLIKTKNWGVDKTYSIEVILYSLVDRSDLNSKCPNGFLCNIWTNDKNIVHRDYGLPAKIKNYTSKLLMAYYYVDGEYFMEQK